MSLKLKTYSLKCAKSPLHLKFERFKIELSILLFIRKYQYVCILKKNVLKCRKKYCGIKYNVNSAEKYCNLLILTGKFIIHANDRKHYKKDFKLKDDLFKYENPILSVQRQLTKQSLIDS